MAIPPARAAVLDFLGFGSVRITREEPQPSRFGQALVLGDPVTLEQARAGASRSSSPRRSGEPDAVYLDEHPAMGPRVDMVYRARPGLPAPSNTGAGLLVTEFRAVADAGDREVGRRRGAKFERLTVGGDPAFFISGAPHGFAYSDPDADEPIFEEQRLAGQHAAGRALRRRAAADRGRHLARPRGRDRRVDALVERPAAGEAGLDRRASGRPTARRAASRGRPRGRRSAAGKSTRPRSRSRTTMSSRSSCSKPSAISTAARASSRPGQAPPVASACSASSLSSPRSASRRRASRMRRTIAPTSGRSALACPGVQWRWCSIAAKFTPREGATARRVPSRIERRLWRRVAPGELALIEALRQHCRPRPRHGRARHRRLSAWRCGRCGPTSGDRRRGARARSEPRRAPTQATQLGAAPFARFDGAARARPGGRRRRRCRPAAGDRRPLAGRGHVAAHEGVPADRCQLGVLRPLAQPLADVVHDERVRQPRQGAQLPRASAVAAAAFAHSSRWATEQKPSWTRCSPRERTSSTCASSSVGLAPRAARSAAGRRPTRPGSHYAPRIAHGTTCSSRQNTARRPPAGS